MPTSLIHLKIGHEYAKKHKQYNNKQFYLGLIAPDAVNLNGFAEKEKRWNAHKRAKDLNDWKNNIINFYKENQEKFDHQYIHGYLIHVLTDILFDEKNPNELFPKIERKVGKEKLREEYSNQMNLYECSQLQEEWWSEVREKLKEAKAETINNIDEKDIEAWKNLILERYNERERAQHELMQPAYINEIYEELERFTTNVNI